MTIAEKLKRLLRPYNRRAVARIAGVNHLTIANILHGKHVPTLGTLKKLSAAIGVEYGWLIDDMKSWPPARVTPATDREPLESHAA